MTRALSRSPARLIPLFAALLTPLPALAQQNGLDLSARASSNEVEVGEAFTIELKAIAEQGAGTASDPELKAPSTFVVSSPRMSSQQYMQLGPGGSVVKTGIGATWQLVPQATGSYVIPGPTVLWRGKRLKTAAIPIEVSASTGRSARRNPFLFPQPSNPGFSFPWPFGTSEPADEEQDEAPSATNELSMTTAPDPNVFLRAIADKKAAVVGEQITVSFYVYYRVDFEMTERREAPLADFVRVGLLKNPGTDAAVYAVAGGRRFAVRKLDTIAIFPVRAGELHTGSMSARFLGRRIGSRVEKRSDDLVITATEPPREGRPPGYTLGDVGQFTLSAVVEPKKVDQGGSIAVTLKVQGTGNFPESLRLPERTGVEWLDPEKRESIDAIDGKVGGYRSFGYVVRVKESGSVDLGKVELPYWNPTTKRYEMAKAELGAVQVRPVTTAPSSSARAPLPGSDGGTALSADPFATLPSPRLTLGAYVAKAPPLLGGARFWWLLGAPPAAFGLFVGASRALRALKAKRDAGKTAPSTLAERALRDAQTAESQGNTKDLASAVERALHHSIEHATGLKARGLLLDELAQKLPAELSKNGIDASLSARICEAFSACDSVRFDPTASAEVIRDLRARAQAIARELLQKATRRKAP